MENPRRFTWSRLGGRRAAAVTYIRTFAADEHEAEMAIADLNERGVAMLTEEGKRYDPPPPPRPRIVFETTDLGQASFHPRESL